jgi:hypothetical protein
VKLARARPNVQTLTLTSQELATLMAAARIALDALRADPHAPSTAVELLERILRDYDRAVARLNADGRVQDAPVDAAEAGR